MGDVINDWAKIAEIVAEVVANLQGRTLTTTPPVTEQSKSSDEQFLKDCGIKSLEAE